MNYVIRLSPKHPGFTVHVDRLREYKMADERDISGPIHGGPIDVVPFPAPKKSKPLILETSHDPRSQRNRKAPRRLIAEM